MFECTDLAVLHLKEHLQLFLGPGAAYFARELLLIALYLSEHFVDVLFDGAQISLNTSPLKVTNIILPLGLHLLARYYNAYLLPQLSDELVHDGASKFVSCLLVRVLLWRLGLGSRLRYLTALIDDPQ